MRITDEFLLLLFIFFMFFVGVILYSILNLFNTVQTDKNIIKKQDDLKEDIKKKLLNGILLTSQDVISLGLAHDLSPDKARYVLYKTLKDYNTVEDFEKIKFLIEQIQHEEPFDLMPDEVKLSLKRLSEIIPTTNIESDKGLLMPITNILSKYQTLLEEQEKTRTKTKIAYILTVLGFAVGLVGVYFNVTAPNAADIAQEVVKNIPTQESLNSF